MNCILPISADFAKLIFDGTKPFDFRNVNPILYHGDKCFLYETKSTGSGKIIGYYTVDSLNYLDEDVNIGTYLYMDTYATLFTNKEIQKLIKKAKSIQLKNYSNDFVLSYLFMEQYLDEMIKTHDIPYIDFSKMSSKELKIFFDTKKRQDQFLYACDNWLRTIGFYNINENDSASWMVEIKIKDVHKFHSPKELSEFNNRKGNKIIKVPNPYCYVL